MRSADITAALHLTLRQRHRRIKLLLLLALPEPLVSLVSLLHVPRLSLHAKRLLLDLLLLQPPRPQDLGEHCNSFRLHISRDTICISFCVYDKKRKNGKPWDPGSFGGLRMETYRENTSDRLFVFSNSG